VLLTGQAAGTLAALSLAYQSQPTRVPVRSVQERLVKAKAYIMPYIDVQPSHPHFEAVQKIGATGILKGTGIPFKWANQTWFYTDSLVETSTLLKSLSEFHPVYYELGGKYISVQSAIYVATKLNKNWYKKLGHNNSEKPEEIIQRKWAEWGLKDFDINRPVTRLELAVLLNNTIDPFSMKAVNHKGVFTD
jgi:hypothetical protein